MTVTDESRLSQATALLRSLGICTAAALLSAGMLYSLFFLARLSFLWGLYPAPFAAAAVAALLLAAFGAAASMMVVRGRTRDATDTTGKFDSVPSPNHAGRAAGWPQSAMAVLFSAPAATVLLVFWPHWNTPALSNGFAGASATLLFATPWVIATRAVGAIGEERLPEVEALRALLWLPALVLFAEAAVLVIASLGLGNQAWAQIAIAVIILVVCAELAVRAIGARFLPPPTRDNAKAQISSVVAQALSSRSLSPVGVAIVMRSQFGMDFSRSWALHFVRSASIPIILLMVGICWFLTGITRVDLNQRGSYERFGYPVAMLTSGLHIVLPWPFGVVRHQELGDVHEVMISNTPVVAGNDHSTAEGPAPASANRLWDSEQPSDVSYLIASGTADRQSFETVSASLRVLYRVGLTDAAARDALYRETDAKGLVRALAGRVLASYFASRTL
ncbi:MAG TPA: hypothetical protein VHB27_12205, partial [Rhodopila sp.]|uniref:hypothetical protein n=1 Tax=Rhodopila sp. TaxID=2480087 RepID=UPI002D01D716